MSKMRKKAIKLWKNEVKGQFRVLMTKKFPFYPVGEGHILM